ncbi:MAG: uroporphyrinogen decarboxylase family protein [bacterium]
MRTFQPDYRNIEDAARNRKPRRVPLYDHGIHPAVMEPMLGKTFWQMMFEGNAQEQVEGYRRFCEFGVNFGYDAIPVEFGATYLVQGGHGLCGHKPGLFKTREEIERFPWQDLPRRYIEVFDSHFKALSEALPPGMKAVGGIGNGIFETFQDFVPLMELPFLRLDDPDGYALLWQKVGDLFVELWSWFLEHHADAFAVCRMGDDLGYRTSTMLSPEDIQTHIIPQYKRVVSMIHAKGKPFLWHSCGRIFDVMDEVIRDVGIDAKHSNEDAIAPIKEWLDRYNDRIAIFGGVDMDLLCTAEEDIIRKTVLNVLELAEHYKGFAIGCGNSIADYVPEAKYRVMLETVRTYRGDF